mmetsp:Transcript_1859/g.4174  ORF Transcript_1859/g.4174 Transcript_1859/m.4174 type:complete len:181 (-) Transcript_1859:341-883(-)
MDTQELRKTIEAVTAERDAISGALAQLQREHEALKQEFGAQQLELRELRKVVAQSHALLGSASAAPRSTAPFNEEKKKGALSARATAPLNEDKKMGALSARAAPISPPNPPAATGKSISPEEAHFLAALNRTLAHASPTTITDRLSHELAVESANASHLPRLATIKTDAYPASSGSPRRL